MLDSTKISDSQLTVVSNRLPYHLTQNETGQWQATPCSGGLARALDPVLKKYHGAWVGWDGLKNDQSSPYPPLDQIVSNAGYSLKPVALSSKEHDNFYTGFSNEIIWPLFHNLSSRCNFNPEYWRTYLQVNQRFSNVIAKHNRVDAFIWVHDYHLMEVARSLRKQGVTSNIGFFLHIPFPPPAIFMMLPWRKEFLRGVLEYNLIGFQTLEDMQNFLLCVQALFPNAEIETSNATTWIKLNESSKTHTIRVGAFPISINFKAFTSQSTDKNVIQMCKRLRSNLPKRKVIFGLERLDYTKGIPNKLLAFRNALQRFPDLRSKVTLIQCILPSREDIPEYQTLKHCIERLISEINGEFTKPGWVPIHYMYHSLEPVELLAYYCAADIALVTPLKDGMNLVAKEYCAANQEDGVLILSEFAGAATQLGGNALLVNPYDIEAIAERIYEAVMMDTAERKQRMAQLRSDIRQHDIFHWANSYLETAL